MQDVETMTKPMVISEIGTIRVRLDRMAEGADRGRRGTFKGREAEIYRNLTERLALLIDAAGASWRERDEQEWQGELRRRRDEAKNKRYKERMIR